METTTRDALVEQLYRTEGKAEIINGGIVEFKATGFLPNQAAGEIYIQLRDYAKRTGRGYALTDNAGFLVDLPNRQSFSPDAAFYTGEPTGMRFLEGAPVFAVEVRSAAKQVLLGCESDYGPAAERQMTEKRADYFAAGTRVVWDVDVQSEDVVRAFREGEAAEAEPALLGFAMPVDDLFA